MDTKISFSEIGNGKLQEFIKQKKTFEVVGASGNISEAVQAVEKAIESLGLSCRIYTKGRIAAAGATVFGGVTGVLGAASAIGIAAHNLATYDPDYEVIKHMVDNKLSVVYQHEEDSKVS
ncbi:hypothetical protein JCM30760_19480 [Thiomicrorhabdus hydrogeniphila]